MTRLVAAGTLGIAALACATQLFAADTSGRDDRLALMVSGSTLGSTLEGFDTDTGWGASALWLHNFSANAILGVGGEHQSISDADWNFGIVSLSYGFGPSERRTTLYVDGREGSGKDLTHSYGYSIYAAGLYQNLTRQLSLQLEDKQIDVDTVHGNLPKLGLQYLWSPKLSTAVSYQHSVSGTLGTRITTVRVDSYQKSVNLFAGAANGQASPVVINLQTGIASPGVVLHEYFVGVAKPFSRADLSVLLDYSKLADTERWTLSFNCMLHKRQGAP
jgi:hypothetical protein